MQVSDQAVRLYQQGWFLPPEDPAAAACTLQDPRVCPPSDHTLPHLQALAPMQLHLCTAGTTHDIF